MHPRPHVDDGSVIILDNFDAHVTAASHQCVETALNSQLCLLPPNCTHVCQPLDVGIMGPYKAILRGLWLKESVNEVVDEVGNFVDLDVQVPTPQKRLATIKRAIEAWKQISEKSVRAAFAKAIPRPAGTKIVGQFTI